MRVGSVEDLEVWTLTGQRPVFTAGRAFDGPVDCAVQVRAHGETVCATAELVDGELVVRLHSALRGVATGQALVLYRPDDADGDEVLASATISATG